MVLQISRASTLSLTCHFDQMGVLLREILAGNFNELSITEASSSQAEPLEMPVEDVVDFFFRQSSVRGNRFQKNRKLYIRSLTNPTVKDRDDLFNAIKERFLNATAPHFLWFWWNPTHVGDIVQEIANPETDPQSLAEPFLPGPSTRQLLQLHTAEPGGLWASILVFNPDVIYTCKVTEVKLRMIQLGL
ncbi:hypothetical protein DdX_19923 [Ditylenchus destructor]|uniref:Uncharacterized protein n=1 Tax=Ditylenchus destructor TaxID=166010 RepID=A0AAD4QWQ1_9BILA|nr:hypothetical protein DdX_19923 [Ditylenchus destructor]